MGHDEMGLAGVTRLARIRHRAGGTESAYSSKTPTPGQHSSLALVGLYSADTWHLLLFALR